MNAFPYVIPPQDGNGCVVAFGMDLRDYFAAAAMQGLLASSVHAPLDEFVKRAYEVADAMMEARTK
jgi:hypothetical protein